MARITVQKKILSELVSKQKGFFDAKDLLELIGNKEYLGASYQKIGLATIYRFLNNLESNGEIHTFICDNRKIYSNNIKNHSHFTCENCGKVSHIDIKNVDFLKGIKKDVNGKVCHFQIDITGVCKNCSK